MSGRSSNFNRDEDILVCQVYMEISQDPIVGANQSGDRLWSRVEAAFNKDRREHWEIRTRRSIQARIQQIERAARKLHACIRVVENMHPSGALNENIMQQAKILFMQDPKFKAGWRYDHVWDIIKNFQKFKDCSPRVRKPSVRYSSSESESQTPRDSPGVSSFSIDLNDEDDNVFVGSSSQRPIGVKKAKFARKTNDEKSYVLQSVQEENKVWLSELQKNSEQMNQHLEIQKTEHARKKKRDDDKILFKDLNSIQDPNLRAIVQADQARIYRERAQQQVQPELFATNALNQYFGDMGGSGSDLPPY